LHLRDTALDPALKKSLNSEDFTEVTRSSRLVYRGKIFDFMSDEVELKTGAMASRDYIKHPGAVVIVPFLDDDTVILERQYRYPVHEHCLEFPAGKLDMGEDRFAAAKRELKEETGYVAQEWSELVTTYPAPAYCDELVTIYIARKLEFVGQQTDEDELLEVIPMAFAEALSLAYAGKIRDQKTMLALMWIAGTGAKST
jgi:ADP-ribose pyrophosphatase